MDLIIDTSHSVQIEAGSLYRTFNLISGANAGEALSGNRIDDIIGVRTSYRLTVSRNANDPSGLDTLLDVVENTEATHIVFLENTVGTLIDEEAYITASDITFTGIKAGRKTWSAIELTITPKAPSAIVSQNEVDVDGATFYDNNLYSAIENRETSLDKSTLGLDTTEAEVKSPSRLDNGYNLFAPITINNGNKYFLTDVKRNAADRYKLSGISSVGRLQNVTHLGGIYSGGVNDTALNVISDICGSIPVIVDAELASVALYGYLPPTSDARNNLAQVLFAIGGSLRTEVDGTLHVTTLPNTTSGTFTEDDIYTGATVETDAAITDVVVYEHSYTPGTDELILFDGTAIEDQLVVFSEPAHALSATGFNIKSSGSTWAVLSAGNGTLTGKNYEHSTREVRGEIVPNAPLKNEKTVLEATLVSRYNVNQVVLRLMSYYACREHLVFSAVSNGETSGDVLSVYHPFDGTQVTGTVEKVAFNHSAILKGSYRLLSGFLPPEAPEAFENEVVLTDSGTWTVPADVTRMNIVLIGGGNGGAKGGNGENATNPSATTNSTQHTYGITIEEMRRIGCAAGGRGGAGGLGGKVYSVIINVTPGDTFAYACGSGGAGETSLTPAGFGTATTFGTHTSADGVSYGNPTYSSYGVPYGGNGVDGMDGGFGSGYRDGSTDPVVAPDIVVEGVTYSAGANPAGYDHYYKYDGKQYNVHSAGSLGGGNAYKANGANGLGSAYSERHTSPYMILNIRKSGDGADAAAPDPETTLGKGGRGGHGGGGAGQIGFPNYLYVSANNFGNTLITLPSPTGHGGSGSAGSAGGDGVIIIQY